MSTSPSPTPAIDTSTLLFGGDPVRGIVSVEMVGPDRVRLTLADGAARRTEDDRFTPWLLAARAEPWAALRSRPTIEPLSGDHPFRHLVTFADWPAFLDAARAADDAGEKMYRLRSPIEQYLVLSGRTLFKGMLFDDLRRLQVDIETLGLNPEDPVAELIVVALRVSDGDEELLWAEHGEADLIERATERIRALDPDVLEGHNLFNFDLPYVAKRAARHGLRLPWGRDGSEVRIVMGQSRFKAGQLTMPFNPAFVHGRHVIDTYQQIQRYDIGGRLTSYGLKNAVEELGLTRPDREFVPGGEIRDLWRSDRDRLLRYALDDVRDVDLLSRLATPTEFYQSQIVPRSYQAVATGGPGEKLNDLMLRAYVQHRHSVPVAGRSRPYAGGHAELLETGLLRPVVKCDVESLYPSIMLSERITAASDTLGALLPMLGDLTKRRLEAKARSRDATLSNAERAMWEGMQGSFKVLINSFYGYLGYGGGLFNDYDAAEQVTLAGQRIVKQVVARLLDLGATPIEVDTDGVYFVPPARVASRADEERFIDAVAEGLPDGIRLAHDGRYAAMLSLKVKTYALRTDDGDVQLRGSSLRSRRLEPVFRDFLRDAARGFLEDERDGVRARYFELVERIRSRDLQPTEISQWGMVTEESLRASPRLKRLVERVGDVRVGERLAWYEREDGELAPLTEWNRDEGTAELLRRLKAVAGRLAGAFASDAELDAFFPAITPRTDLDAARAQESTRQLSLFG